MSELPQPEFPPRSEKHREGLVRRPAATSIVPRAKENDLLKSNFPPRSPAPAAGPGRFAKSAEPPAPKSAVLRGLKDLQQLQKQTLAVLEAVKGSLDDIEQVLRSPEATRGMEKQKNAATLLAKGFPRDAVEQAMGAAQLLPANPEAHLLLALSLAADDQLEPALGATRKGLALIDRRVNPLAIEAGLLHTLGVLGNVAEALERWSVIIDALPLPVLLEQTGTIAACFPVGDSDDPAMAGGPVVLDGWLCARLVPAAAAKENTSEKKNARATRLIDTAAGEIPPSALLAGLDAAGGGALPRTHKAILAQTARRLHATQTPADVLKFLSECVVPLSNRNLDRVTGALSKAAWKKFLRLHADAPTLYRALTKFQMAGASVATREAATLLRHWRRAGKRTARTKSILRAGGISLAAGIALLCVFFALSSGPLHLASLLPCGTLIVAGAIMGLLGVFLPAPRVSLPHNRPPLTPEELQFLAPAAIRHALKMAARNA